MFTCNPLHAGSRLPASIAHKVSTKTEPNQVDVVVGSAHRHQPVDELSNVLADSWDSVLRRKVVAVGQLVPVDHDNVAIVIFEED